MLACIRSRVTMRVRGHRLPACVVIVLITALTAHHHVGASISSPFLAAGQAIIAPGVVHEHGTFSTTTAGVQVAHLLEIDTDDPAIRLEASLSNDRIAGLETTTSQANRLNREGHRAVAAINADFWGLREAPSGLHIQAGEVMSAGASARPTACGSSRSLRPPRRRSHHARSSSFQEMHTPTRAGHSAA